MFLAGKAALLRSATTIAFALSISTAPTGASAQTNPTIRIVSQDLGTALMSFSHQVGRQIMFSPDVVRGKRSNPINGSMPTDQALSAVLRGTGLTYRAGPSGGYLITPQTRPAPKRRVSQATAAPAIVAAAPPSEPAAPVSSNDIIVTAQRRREPIQDIPIAISAFTQESLDKQKIEGGPDLLKAVPNLTFSKSNFAGYNLEIRGIGTKAISVSTDPGVAIDFNSTTLINNRFFEQEFFDLERVEVLRGPQGTLYGRNATGGVVNIISHRADLDKFGGYVKGELGNFASKRLQGAVNIPIVDDVFGIRVAGAWTKRNGFTKNDFTGNRVDGRDLYTTRFSATLKPSTRYRADLVWERFAEDDNRARTAKQLCHRDDGPSSLGDLTNLSPVVRGFLSQGCKPGSLYGKEAYGVPNGLSLPYVLIVAGEAASTGVGLGVVGSNGQTILQSGVDPYAGTTQIQDRRRFSANFDPKYKADSNVVELNQTWDVTDGLALTSQTAYNQDNYNSSQDYNRFNTVPIFTSTDENSSLNLLPGGYFNDPQLGISNRLLARDLVTAKSKQFSQEIRISTTGKGPFQFTAGGNYTYYRNITDYYVFINSLTAFAQASGIVGNDSIDPRYCKGVLIGNPGSEGCIYIDPNPIDKLNKQGHNYFRSDNRYRLDSYGAFVDGTYELTPNFKLIGGVRYNDDTKTTTPVPSQLLTSTDEVLYGTVDAGYPADPDIKQHFTALTGRAGVQWKPRLRFTNDTMIYFTYSRGYKGGGTNPPPVGFLPGSVPLQSFAPTFKPEYVNSLEIGMKNTLLNNRLTLNATGYYYDFTNYQVSQILDRSAVNENFSSKMYGLEFETVYKPFRNLAINANLGYQHTRIDNNQYSLDVLNRTQGNPDYVLVKPFAQTPSNCVVSKAYVERLIAYNRANGRTDEESFLGVCPSTPFLSSFFSPPIGLPTAADLPNGGRGFYANVGGNQLPNAPHLTLNVGIEYNIPVTGDWVLTPRADFYHQSGSYARVYNTVADRLRGWENVNLSMRVGNPTLGLLVEAYVKNLLDSSPITDGFVNSDDTGLPTNIFTFDPRIIGVNVTKKF